MYLLITYSGGRFMKTVNDEIKPDAVTLSCQ
jgi:hypothetical protein